jgi:hypothetical protein
MTAAANAAANDYVLAVRACLANGGKKNPRYKAVTYVQNAAGVVHPARATPPATVRSRDLLDRLPHTCRVDSWGSYDTGHKNEHFGRAGRPPVRTTTVTKDSETSG